MGSSNASRGGVSLDVWGGLKGQKRGLEGGLGSG
jgi:hypothetical protein